jgi:hypothetical protein
MRILLTIKWKKKFKNQIKTQVKESKINPMLFQSTHILNSLAHILNS